MTIGEYHTPFLRGSIDRQFEDLNGEALRLCHQDALWILPVLAAKKKFGGMIFLL